MNNNMNDKKNKTSYDDFVDISDVEIDNLSFEMEGVAGFNGKAQGNIDLFDDGNFESSKNNDDKLDNIDDNESLENTKDDSLDEKNSSNYSDKSSDYDKTDESTSLDDSSDIKNDDLNNEDLSENKSEENELQNDESIQEDKNDKSEKKDSDKKDSQEDKKDSQEDKKDSQEDKKESNNNENDKNADKQKNDSEDGKTDKNTDNQGKNSEEGKTDKNPKDKNTDGKQDNNSLTEKNNSNNKDDRDEPKRPLNSNKGEEQKANQNPNQNQKKGEGANSRKKGNKPNTERKAPSKNKTPKKGNNPFMKKKAGKGLKNTGQKVGKKIGNAAKKVGNKVGKAAGKVAKEVGKKVAQLLAKLLSNPYVLAAVIIIIVLLVVIFFLIVPAIGATMPGQGNDINDEFNNFSAQDQEILKKINSFGSKPNAELALFTVVYPYFESIRDGSIDSILDYEEQLTEEEKSKFDEFLSEKKNEILASFGCDESCQDLMGEDTIQSLIKIYAADFIKEGISNWISGDEETDDEFISDMLENDPYIQMFKKTKYQKKYRELLEKLSSSANDGNYYEETAFFDSLDEYFESDEGYRALFKKTQKNEELKELIINDLKANAGSFAVYILNNNCITGSTFTSGGQVTVDDNVINEMMKGNVLIDLLEPGCGSLDSCNSYYGEPLTLERYVKGVTYEELGSSDDRGQIGAQMVAAKSFILGRHLSSVTKTDDGVYVIKARWSTADQDFCDYKLGCEEVSSNHGYNNFGDCLNSDGSNKCMHHANRAPASSEKQTLYDEIWEETKDYYIMDDGIPTGNYYAGCPDNGKCMDHEELETLTGLNYKDVLQEFYYNCEYYTVEGEFMNLVVATPNNACVNGGIGDEEFIYYSQKDYPHVPFCGANSSQHINSCAQGSNSICSSGCGVTSMAMVVANLTYNSDVTPEHTNELAKNQSGACAVGNGTQFEHFYQTAKVYDLEYTSLSIDSTGAQKAIQALKNGGLIIANVGASSPFTNGGHYIVIRKVDENGKVYVADPNHPELFDEPYSIDDFYTKGWVTNGWLSFMGPRSPEFANSNNSSQGSGNATGYLGNPLRQDISETFINQGNASTYPYYSNGSCHGAIDLETSEGTTAYAMDGGVVIQINDYNGKCTECDGYNSYGNLVVIDHGNGYTTWYGHLKERKVNKGDKVSKGQLIGYTGDTGHSTGPHIHLELIKTDLLAANGGRNSTTKCSEGMGLLNPAKYINSGISYVGKTK